MPVNPSTDAFIVSKESDLQQLAIDQSTENNHSHFIESTLDPPTQLVPSTLDDLPHETQSATGLELQPPIEHLRES